MQLILNNQFIWLKTSKKLEFYSLIINKNKKTNIWFFLKNDDKNIDVFMYCKEIFVIDNNIEYNVKLIDNLFTKSRAGQRGVQYRS